MDGETGKLPDFSNLQRGPLTYFPVVPGRLEFACAVRERILVERPRIVAVELPSTLQDKYLLAVKRLPELSVLFYSEAREETTALYVPVEPADPFTEAIRSGLEVGAEIVFVDPDTGDRPHLPDTYPDTYSIRHIGLTKYIELYRVFPQLRSDEVVRHADGIAWKLQGVDPLASVLVVLSLNLLDPVLDSMERPQSQVMLPRSRDIQLVNPHPNCLAEICTEYPFLQARYEEFRTDQTERALTDRLLSQSAVFRDAAKEYEINTGDLVLYWQRRLLARYARNLALMNRELTASLFDFTVAARAIVDDNYAWEVWEIGGRYPVQRTESELPTIEISGDEVWLNTKKIRLRRRLPSIKRRLRPRGLKARQKEKTPGEWASQVDGNHICSYPPEDIVIEDYGRYLKKRGKSILSEERSRSEPFSTSLLDGIDIRETIRNWQDGRVYVRNNQTIQGEVGAVIVIFEEDAENRYTYMTTWLGEHQNESDMAFYSTYPFDHLVGPGIGRGEYGGFLMTLPARRLYDVWNDRDYDFAENKPERLLLAALDYSLGKFVVYVGAKPPRSIFRDIAARFGRTIVYIPIGQLSPVTIKKIRVVHVLDGYEKRELAKQYIW